jgi:hypothetical protein
MLVKAERNYFLLSNVQNLFYKSSADVDSHVGVLICWWLCRCVDDCVDVLMCWWLCWCVADYCVDVLITVWRCWCVDVLMCWCVDVLVCRCVDVLMTVSMLTCRCVDVLMCWGVGRSTRQHTNTPSTHDTSIPRHGNTSKHQHLDTSTLQPVKFPANPEVKPLIFREIYVKPLFSTGLTCINFDLSQSCIVARARKA